MIRIVRGAALGALLALQTASGIRAQEADSLRSYEMAEIVIGETAPRRNDPAALRRIPLAEIARSDAGSVAGIARLLPAAHIQTNSRGETLIYLRGAGERQVAIFLDGALMNVPWDNRIDLSFIPSGILGGMGVAHGASSVLYGTNTVGGVLLLTSRNLDRPGRLSELSISGGTAGWQRFEGMHLVRGRRQSLLVGAGFSSTDGQPVPKGADLEYEPNSRLRINTDRQLAHAFVRYGLDVAGVRWSASLLHASGRQGIAPEGHLDPAKGSVRYWRYPRWAMMLGSLSMVRDLRADEHLRATAWVSRFAQRIDQFESIAYRSLGAREDDEDLTVGGRVSYDRPAGQGALVLAATGFASSHRQVDAESEAGLLVPSPQQTYSQLVWSLGSEYRSEWSRRVRTTVGLGLEGIGTPETGDKPPRPGQASWTTSMGGVVDLSNGWSIRAAAGRKLRFPTPRELFGTALGRFLVDSGLRPESAWSADLGAVRSFEDAELETTVFYRRTFDTIDQENVVVDGGRFRRRINLDGSSALGIEVAGRLEPREGLEVEGHATVMRGRVIGVTGRTKPVEKPEILATAIATWRFGRGIAASVQGTWTGRAWGLGLENELVALPDAIVLDTRMAWRRLVGSSGVFAEVFVRVDNVFDELTMAQLGLPGAGRLAKAGISLSL